ncbi:MAG: hypothetical protein L0G06_09260, partial [Enterobacterales bacterium]|nr:hypothetical protein [Enterobacterales bacterium]MDN6116036.1 hypothetical protein [Enterobacterales bacterium]MDN6550659.1 hypothetical protein [Enterobacterales bacterium]MDN6834005.1 hypothetical protein [Enterobacterales bacterium]
FPLTIRAVQYSELMTKKSLLENDVVHVGLASCHVTFGKIYLLGDSLTNSLTSIILICRINCYHPDGHIRKIGNHRYLSSF